MMTGQQVGTASVATMELVVCSTIVGSTLGRLSSLVVLLSLFAVSSVRISNKLARREKRCYNRANSHCLGNENYSTSTL